MEDAAMEEAARPFPSEEVDRDNRLPFFAERGRGDGGGRNEWEEEGIRVGFVVTSYCPTGGAFSLF